MTVLKNIVLLEQEH